MSDSIEIDPDVVQAITDLTPIVLALRRLSAALAKEPEDGRHRPNLERQIREMNQRITERAARIPMKGDALLRILNDALDNKARRGRHAPTRPSSRTLLRSLTEAQQARDLVQLEANDVAARLAAANRAVDAASEACRAWGAASLVVSA